MMVPFDGAGAPQQGQPAVAPPPLPRPPMPGPHQPAPSPVGMPVQHHGGPGMGAPPYGAGMGGHRNSVGSMPGQPPFPIPPQSPAQQRGSFSGMPGGQYSSHPPLHSPHQQGGPPMHHHQQHPQHQQQHGYPQQQMHRQTSMNASMNNSMNGSMSRQHSVNMPGMPPNMGPHDHMQNMGQHDHMQQQQQQRSSVTQHSQQGAHGQGRYMGNTSGSLNGSWQSDKDTPHRREMIQNIVKILKKDKNGNPESMSKLPQMAKQLEVSLYRNARSFEAYMDMATLKQRLQQIAVEVSRKARSQNDPNRMDDRRYNDRSSMMNQQQQQQQPPPQQGYGQNGMRDPSGHIPGASSPFGNSNQQSSRMVNMDAINPMANGNDMSRQNSASQYGQQRSSMQQPMQQPDHSMGRGGGTNSSTSPPSSSMSGNRNDPEWKIRIRHKQQRLLLLHHSAKCPHEDGRCQVTPHCADMKRLWRHMEGCKDNNCRVSHCFSSRAILSHYRKCKDPNCPACGPVRDTVRKAKQNPVSSGSRSGGGGGGGGGLMGSSSMRGMNTTPVPPPQSEQNNMMSQPDQLMGGPTGSYSSGSSQQGPGFQQQHGNMRQTSSQGAMPPPPHNSSHNSSQSMPYSSQQQQQSQQQQPQQHYRQQSSSSSAQPMYRPDQQNMDSRMPSQQQPPPPNQPSSSSSHGQSGGIPPAQPSSNRSSSTGGARNDSEWQKIRHKQQRLLLLRHASRCQHEAGKCPVTPHCASMKKLWEHIAHCKNSQCTVQHCLSSRYVLSHYRRCKDPRCPACGPVRDTIRKGHERERSRQQQPSTQPSLSMSSSMDGGLSLSDQLMNEPTDQNAPPSSANATSPAEMSSMSGFEPDRKRSKTEQTPAPPSAPPQVSSTPAQPPAPVPTPPAPAPAPPPAPEPARQESQDPSPPPPPVPPPAPPAPPSAPTPAPAPVPIPSPGQKIQMRASKMPRPQAMEPQPKPEPPKPEKSSSSNEETPQKNPDHALLDSFTVKELQTHLNSLNRKTQLPPAKLKTKCSEVLKGLQTHQHGWVFNCPVDPVELGLPDYFDIIKKPMDLGTIQKRLDAGTYHHIDDFMADVNLTFDNAMSYNEDGSVVYDMAKELKAKFETDITKLLSQLEAEDEERRSNERACTLCGCEKLLFEPPVYFCNGLNCQSQRIRRNSHFYIGGNNQYFWCSPCYNELDEKTPIELIDMTIMKANLKKKKNDEVHEESWVQCDGCNRWVHQICGLFNTRLNKEQHSVYSCPKCLLKKKKAEVVPASTPKPPSAADLPRTTLSEWLEQHISKKVALKKREIAENRAQTENITLQEAMSYVESGGSVIIRQVTAMDRKLEVRELMKKRYAHKNYPDEFPFRCKCIVVFQQIDGVDVILFALYVYEHGEDNPPPNKRCVYISYLDSVHFMRPRKLRTFVYHEILIAYLDYARRKGYATAHIWACPPLKGDDYIFYAKPEDQKTPRDSRLRQWYIDMLTDCQKRNIVGKVTNMYDLYFADENIDATAVPYLEGDYFPGEAENIIKMLQEGGGKKGGGGGKKKKSKHTKNKGTTGTRANGLDEEALIASGMMDGVKNLKELDRDQVMVKLGETIQPMKDSFIVAFLNWSGAREEDLVVSEEIEKARIEYAAKDDAELVGSKRDPNGNPRDSIAAVDKDGRPVKVIDDDDEDLDCEFLNNRQAFLNLCRGNHYQFDELRRAKHTSMMVLWHLHNRDAPKFVQQCVACSREILSGKRFHCNTCPDYDLCQDCYKDPNVNRGACTHKLQAVAVEPEASQETRGGGLTDAERLQRQRNLMLHIQLIEHASRCNSKTCTSTNCQKMKSYLHHARICQQKVTGGCRICKRIWTLLRIHAQKCKDPNCPIPQCTAIREKMRQLQKQQQAMDDRRRLEMNRHMRFSGSGAGH